ncbi:hypothetical protein Bealeia1_00959 [Candidatus Bealeia paramacronuclearis]|uniref:Uncharacterized protein n=1 Tax=Candidatus Bealeia paramacronuclearis TaxID=1921001 RepID=A0ABZ2C2U8_9PROT|nr:hypothetical protein [Candidatus Bealeia paramacronuclearis]
MDIGFHYYLIKLLCVGLGMPEPDARIVAQSSQHVDDNIYWRKIDEGLSTEFPVVATFSIDHRQSSDSTYPTLLLHFPPGDGPDVPGVARKDGKWFEGITTPGAKMAQESLDKAIQSGNLYLIGTAAHTMADTHAHQGFSGCVHECNKNPAPSLFGRFLPPLGHGEFEHLPDLPVNWMDSRLKGEACKINNKERFYAAAKEIAEKLDPFINPKSKKEEREFRINSVLEKVFKAFGEPIPAYERKSSELELLAQVQIYDFRKLAQDEQFGGQFMEIYDREKWRDASIFTQVRGIDDDKFADVFQDVVTSILPDKYYWMDTYYQNVKTHFEKSKSTTVKIYDVDTKVKFFETFPAKSTLKEWPEVVKNITCTPYYKFHVAAQTHLAHLIKKTEERTARDKGGQKIISLYKYYDDGKQEAWVGAMKKRTLAYRAEIYGDTE